MVQRVGPKGAQDELLLKDKIDAANLELKHMSHGVVLDRTKLSFGLRVGRTTILEILVSNKAMYMVLAL